MDKNFVLIKAMQNESETEVLVDVFQVKLACYSESGRHLRIVFLNDVHIDLDAVDVASWRKMSDFFLKVKGGA